MLCPHVLTFINSRSTLLFRNWDKTEIKFDLIFIIQAKKGKKQQRTDNGDISDWNMIDKTKELIKKSHFLSLDLVRNNLYIENTYVAACVMIQSACCYEDWWTQQSGVWAFVSPLLPFIVCQWVGGNTCVRMGRAFHCVNERRQAWRCTGKRACCSIRHGIRFEWCAYAFTLSS